jgi:hypothetical protein
VSQNFSANQFISSSQPAPSATSASVGARKDDPLYSVAA